MNEQELEQRRKEFRETEIQNKIASYSQHHVSASEFRQHTLKANYTYKKIDRTLGKFAKFLIIFQAVGLCFFSSLYVFSYIPKTKPLVAKVMP